MWNTAMMRCILHLHYQGAVWAVDFDVMLCWIDFSTVDKWNNLEYIILIVSQIQSRNYDRTTLSEVFSHSTECPFMNIFIHRSTVEKKLEYDV